MDYSTISQDHEEEIEKDNNLVIMSYLGSIDLSFFLL
jgi:hypothetical protein